jgi:Zn-dependent protease with chaperone function
MYRQYFKEILCLVSVLSVLTCSSYSQARYPFEAKDSVAAEIFAQEEKEAVLKYYRDNENIYRKFKKVYRANAEQSSQESYYQLKNRALKDSVIEPYVQKVFSKLVKSLPKSAQNAQLVLIQSPIINAKASATGLIYVYTGLIAALDNEEQLAFVIGHELGHLAAAHSDSSLANYLETYYTKEYIKQVKQVIKEEYYINSRLTELYRNNSLNGLYHSRAHEYEADAFGFSLLKKAGYSPYQAQITLEKLDKVDIPFDGKDYSVATSFVCESTYNLWQQTEKAEESIFAVVEENNQHVDDTLKTHPDSRLRTERISELLEGDSGVNQERANVQQYNKVKLAAAIESTQSWFDYRQYGRCLFEALAYKDVYPDQPYFTAISMICLYKLQEALINHTYYKVLSGPGGWRPNNIVGFVEELEKLDVDNFTQMAICLDQVSSISVGSSQFDLLYKFARAKLLADNTLAESYSVQYQKLYPLGKYSGIFKEN